MIRNGKIIGKKNKNIQNFNLSKNTNLSNLEKTVKNTLIDIPYIHPKNYFKHISLKIK